MAFTYDLSKLSEDTLFQVRFRIGDNVDALHELEDEEIQYLLKMNNNDVDLTALACCDVMLTKMANAIDFKVGPYSESGTDARYNRWLTLRKTLAAAQANYSAPVAQNPTTAPIFNYDMMSAACCGDSSDNG